MLFSDLPKVARKTFGTLVRIVKGWTVHERTICQLDSRTKDSVPLKYFEKNLKCFFLIRPQIPCYCSLSTSTRSWAGVTGWRRCIRDEETSRWLVQRNSGTKWENWPVSWQFCRQLLTWNCVNFVEISKKLFISIFTRVRSKQEIEVSRHHSWNWLRHKTARNEVFFFYKAPVVEFLFRNRKMLEFCTLYPWNI